ncbi:hypothetical protein ACFLSJ_06945 [Verrucomicrobiota bacterium]
MWRNVIKKVIRPIAKPLLRRSTRNLSDDDVWTRTEEHIPFKQFGAANLHDWPWYLEGKSTVEVTSPKESTDLPPNDSNVDTALRILAQRQLTWSELYKLLESVQADQGSDYPITAGVTTEAQLRRFKHTANSMAAIGDDARHGPKSQQPPSTPMTMDDARDLLRSILKHWLAEKRVRTP